VPDELGRRLRAALEPLLEPGEQLRGACVATQVGMFRGQMVALGATDRRLLVQGIDRQFRPKDEPLLIGPGEVTSASIEGGGGDYSGSWEDLGAMVMNAAAVAVKLKTTSGAKRKLSMMRGGTGMLGKLGGGESQGRGVEALGEWLAAHAPAG
jgi:hypothetical protein